MKPKSRHPEQTGSASDTRSSQAMRETLERNLSTPLLAGTALTPPSIPDHELLRRIGAGAYGEVWLARSALGTLRAVKVVYRAHFKEDRPYEREFNGILKYEPVSRTHEGLVQVLHVGRNDAVGCFYYVMELADEAVGKVFSESVIRISVESKARDVTGPLTSGSLITDYSPRTLRSELARQQRLPPADAAQFVLRLANALGHLHKHGLVHRDIKPSNVIFVGGQPKLADIGLVTDVGSSQSFVGTEGFIPPEGPGTPQADLYGLGKLLYELATGRDRLDFPQLPPEVTHLTDGEALLELNEVMVRACAPDPKQRYATTTELQAELNLFLAGRSLRRARNVERHLARLKKIAVAACVFLVLAAVALWMSRREEQFARELAQAANERARSESESRAKESGLRQRAEAAEVDQSRLREEAQRARANETRLRQKAEAQELAARKKAYASDMNLLQLALAADDLGRAQELLDRQRPRPGEQDLRGWEWRYFWQFCQSDAAFKLCQRSNSVINVSFSSDGTLLAIATYMGGEVSVWDVATRQMLFRRTAGTTPRLAFAPTGETLAYYNVADQLKSVVVCNGRTGAELRRLPLSASVRDLAFTRDGRLFVADAGVSNNITLWNTGTGELETKFTARVPTYAMGTVFNITGDGSTFVHAMQSPSHSVRVMHMNGGFTPPVRVADELTTALALSPDGQTLITGAGYSEGTVKFWNPATHQLLGSLEGHRSWVSSLKFLPDGKTLASASADRTIRLWDFETRQPIRTLRGQGGELWTIDVSPDGRWLASGGKDGSVMLWDLASTTYRPPEYRTLSPVGSGWGSDFSPDGRWFTTIQGRTLQLYDAQTLERVTDAGITLMNIISTAFSPDSKLLVATDREGYLRVWDVPGRRMITNFQAHPGPAGLGSSAFIDQGRQLLTYGEEKIIKEWDAATWHELRRWPVDKNLSKLAMAPATELMATATADGLFELIDLRDPVRRWRFTGENRLVRFVFSPDGRTLAAASENGTVELWDTQTRTRTALLRGVLLGYHSVSISPDGARVAAGSNGQEAIKLWDLASQEEVATLAGRGSIFTDAVFSVDGNSISARNWKGVLHFWTAPSWKQIEVTENRDAHPLVRQSQ